MTDQEINLAIAEACGWVGEPDYLNDLNAVHDAAMSLKERDGKAYLRYQQNLIAWDGLLYPDAPAKVRAQAIVKALGKLL